MYPTLSEFLKEVLGINIPLPIQTYGFFVALAFIIGTFILMFELKRKEKLNIFFPITRQVLIGEKAKWSELLISGIIGFILGFKLFEAFLHYSDFVDNPQDFILSARGSYIGGLIGAFLLAGVKFYEKEKSKLKEPHFEDRIIHPHELSGNLLMIAAIFGILGAKIFHNLENINEFIENPISSLFSFSGLSFYGGLICGSISGLVYGRMNKLNIIQLIDSASPALALAYGIGRLGCHISGDGCWGIENFITKPAFLGFIPDWLWAYNYPHNVIDVGAKINDCLGKHCHVLMQPVFPTSLYESIMALISFAILWSLRKKIKIPGILFCIYLIFVGLERFFIEQIRINETYKIFGTQITQAEIISILLIILGFVGLIYLLRKNYIKKRKEKADSVDALFY